MKKLKNKSNQLDWFRRAIDDYSNSPARDVGWIAAAAAAGLASDGGKKEGGVPSL